MQYSFLSKTFSRQLCTSPETNTVFPCRSTRQRDRDRPCGGVVHHLGEGERCEDGGSAEQKATARGDVVLELQQGRVQ